MHGYPSRMQVGGGNIWDQPSILAGAAKPTRPDTRAKTLHRALLILRSIPSSIRPTPSSIQLIVDEYDNEGNDQKHKFLHLSLALLDLTVEKYDNEWMDGWMNGGMNEWMNELHEWWTKWGSMRFHTFSVIFNSSVTDQPTNQPTDRPTDRHRGM